MVIARAVRGMNDMFEPELSLWRTIERALQRVAGLYGYEEIRTPILEDLILFKRGIGETTDIVEKEMFVVPDNEHQYCLRPENTASVVRALIERGGLSLDSLLKYYYFGPMFRKERPQRGRLRQFHQFGMEIFGVKEAVADIEILVMVDQFFKELGLHNLVLKVNTLGDDDERARYKEELRTYFSNHKDQLCEDCRRRLSSNILRLLDCKNPSCQEVVKNAPNNFGVLGKESRMHFDQVLQGLSDNAVNHALDHHLVRGLDYYNKTVFEFVATSGLGAQNTVAGGGRYDGLFQKLGNKIDLPSIGCAGGVERMVLLLTEQNELRFEGKVAIALIGADDEGKLKAQELAFLLRKLGIAADFSLVNKSLKAQMRRADKLGASFVAVIGANELQKKKITLKSLSDGLSQELNLDIDQMLSFLNSNSN